MMTDPIWTQKQLDAAKAAGIAKKIELDAERERYIAQLEAKIAELRAMVEELEELYQVASEAYISSVEKLQTARERIAELEVKTQIDPKLAPRSTAGTNKGRGKHRNAST